jgi:lysozyme
MKHPRVAIGALTLSAAALVSLFTLEGYTDKAVIPVPGDVPTVGFGTTDGVKMGDSIDPVTAVNRGYRDVVKFENQIKTCVKVPLYQHEYDAYTKLTYNIGGAAFCKSSIPAKLNSYQYDAACETILDFVCGPATMSTRALPGQKCFSLRKPMRVIKGLQNRRQEEYKLCRGLAQQ